MFPDYFDFVSYVPLWPDFVYNKQEYVLGSNLSAVVRLSQGALPAFGQKNR